MYVWVRDQLGVQISPEAVSLIRGLKATNYRDIELVKVRGNQLGLSRTATYSEIVGHAKKFGLCPCPQEVGPVLRVEYKDQPNTELLIIATDPVRGENVGEMVLFCLDVEGGSLALASHSLAWDWPWPPETVWVFMRE